MKKIAFAGTFDPITNGHLWVIEEGLNMAEEVVVMVAYNAKKNTMFTDLERKDMIEKSLLERGISDRVKTVIIKNEYVAQSAQHLGCDYLIRGIRGAQDFDYENLIQKTNTDVLMGAKTLFVFPPRDLDSVSSSFIKSLMGPVGWHWNIKKFLTAAVYNQWMRKYVESMIDKFSITLDSSSRLSLLDSVIESYSEKGRFYHNLDHIAHCLQELEWTVSNHPITPSDAEKLLLSILSHDIVYKSKDKTLSDEEQSALWFENFGKAYDKNWVNDIAQMIRNTAYAESRSINTVSEEIMCSIDLSVLAQHPSIYNWYTDAVRHEYAHVNDKDFIQGRIKVLESFLSQERIYDSPYFEHYEQRARSNLAQEIVSLKSIPV